MTDIEIERGDELYKGRGRVWLEAGSDLGVSRGALAEIGVHGLIDEDAPPHVEGVEPLVPLVGAPGLRDSVRAPLLDDEADHLFAPLPDFICRRGPTTAREVRPTVEPRTRAEIGREDAQKLALILDQPDLKASTRSAFEEMRASLKRYPSLTDRQRGWVDSELDERGLSIVDPAVRNANVPRGREVAPAAVLQQLPLAPPGRRLAPELVEAAFRTDGAPPLAPLPVPSLAPEKATWAPIQPATEAAITKARNASLGAGPSGIPTKPVRRRSKLAD